MSKQVKSAWFASAAALLAFALPATASATEEFPSTIQRHLGLSDEPPCALCHENGMVGMGTVRTPFGMALRLLGLAAENDDSLTTALDELQKEGVDSDRDGVTDIDELKAGTDPNRAGVESLSQSNEPVYGCGGTVARSKQGATAASGLALGALALALSVRRRSQRAG